MPQKIKIIKLEKTPEYISTEMALLKSQMRSLLASTDWTQLPDSGLSTECQLRFRVWRNLIRSVVYDDYETVLLKYNNLRATKPDSIKPGAKYKFVTNNFDFSNPLSLINSCNQILRELGIDETVNFSEDTDILENFFRVLKQNGY